MPYTPTIAWKGDLSVDYNGYEVIFLFFVRFTIV